MEDADNNNKTHLSKGCAPAASTGGGREEADYYVNEEGLVVFTAKYLMDRGYCCGNGCKHCPYNYEAVPEPKRSYLLQARRDKHDL